MKVKELPLDDRPREKLLLRGAQTLSDSELVAIILRTGTKGESVLEVAKKLLSKYNDLAQLATQSVSSLTKNNGIGRDKAATLCAAFEMTRRIESQQKWLFSKKISSPNDIAEIFIPLLRDKTKEEFLVICLNSANKIINYETITIGLLNSSLVHPREVFKVAIENNSANIVLAHNHPSGNTDPSEEDITITKKMVDAGKILGINVFDHIIIGHNSFSSLVEKRLI
jgi:DNA repair protein RadC